MITKIEATNYRCLRSVSQTLAGFHVVAGPNGSGKSTFFEVPKVMAAFGRDGLGALWEASHATRFEELLCNGSGASLELAVEMAVPDAVRDGLRMNGKAPRVVRYEFRIGYGPEDGPEDRTPRILNENLWLLPESAPTLRSQVVQMELEFPSASRNDYAVVHDAAPRGANWQIVAKKTPAGNSYFKAETTKWNLQIRNPSQESALRSLPSDERFPLSNWFRQQLLEGAHHLALNSEAMRQSSPPLKKGGFLPDGSNLPHVVAALPEGMTGKAAWVEHLRTVLPIESIETVTREDTRFSHLLVHYRHGATVPSWHLSDGTLRLLALTLLPYLPQTGAVFFIEEPENGIHPQAVESVFQSLNSLYEGQVLVATHSPVLVGLCEPRHLLCFSKSAAGETDILTGSEHPKLRDWQRELPLSRLYAAGILS